MAQTNFKAGDVVRLKSGSPDMTVSEVITTKRTYQGREELPVNTIKVQWFEGFQVHYGEFTEPQLEKVEKSNDEYFS